MKTDPWQPPTHRTVREWTFRNGLTVTLHRDRGRLRWAAWRDHRGVDFCWTPWGAVLRLLDWEREDA